MKPPTLAQMAEAYECTVRTLSRARADGVDLADEAAFRNWQANQQFNPHHKKQAKPLTDDAEPEYFDDDEPLNLPRSQNYDEARIRRTDLDSRKIALQIAETRKKLVRVADIREEITRVAAALQAGISRMEGELPGILEGMTAGQMAKKIRDYADDLILRLQDDLSKISNREDL